MASNFKFSGKRITIKNVATAVTAGAICRRSGFVAIPLISAAAGASVAFALEGVWGMTFAAYGGMVTASLVKAGTILYWDVANAALTIGTGANDMPCVKCVTDVSTTDGSFQGLLLPQARPKTADQA
jgi:predicted RecA/RadA family phage recombinase